MSKNTSSIFDITYFMRKIGYFDAQFWLYNINNYDNA